MFFSRKNRRNAKARSTHRSTPLRLETLEDRCLLSFGGGIVGTDVLATGSEWITSVALQSDSRIVVAGSGSSGNVARYNADGTLDTSFNAGGSQPGIITPPGIFNGVVVQADGKIVAGGRTSGSADVSFLVRRYAADGTPDATFGSNGAVTTNFTKNKSDQIYALAIQPADQKIVAVGYSNDSWGGSPEWTVVRYNTNGSLDTSFDRDGKVTTTFGGQTSAPIPRALVVQSDGKILVAGDVNVGTVAERDFVLARYNANGSLDQTFGQGGKVRTDFAAERGYNSSNDSAWDIAVQADGKIVVVGKSSSGLDRVSIARYNANGSLDSTFDGNGMVILDLQIGEFVRFDGLAIQADGKIVAVGGGDIALVARFNADGSLDASFDGDGLKYSPFAADPSFANDVLVQPDGKILIGGSTGWDGERTFALARLNADGTFDSVITAFVTSRSGGLDEPQGLAFGPDGNLYVTSYYTHQVLRYDGATGAYLGAFVAAGSGGLNEPVHLVFGPNGDLFVTSSATDQVLRYDGTTGAFLGAFVAAGSGGLDRPTNLLFHDGKLYVAGYYSDNVLRYDGLSGAFLDVFVPAGSGGLGRTTCLAFGSDGNLYVAAGPPKKILRYSGTTGAFLDEFVSPGSGGLEDPTYILFESGYLYVSNRVGDNVLRYDAVTGAFVDAYVPARAGGLRDPQCLAFGADGSLYVCSAVSDEVLRVPAFFTTGAPLQAVLAAPQQDGAILTDSQVQPLLAEAIARWQSAGANVSGLASLDVRIADLGGNYLGMASGSTIWLDDNAAGWGWFVDATPWDNSEFTTPGNQGEQNHMDLLTVLEHELGHVLGFDHADDGVMQEALPAGTRWSLSGETAVLTPVVAGRLDAYFAEPVEMDATALAIALDPKGNDRSNTARGVN